MYFFFKEAFVNRVQALYIYRKVILHGCETWSPALSDVAIQNFRKQSNTSLQIT